MRNIIFGDGEFTGLYPDGTEFISLALVKDSGEELYMEIYAQGKINEWTQENVVPYLAGEPISKEEAKLKISKFVGNGKPYFLSYVNQFDWMGICGLFGVFDVPFFWIPLDFASILHAKGIDPALRPEDLAELYGIPLDDHQPHHALSDARLIRKLYQALN